MDVQSSNSRVSRFLRQLKGQPNSGATFSHRNEPVTTSETSSETVQLSVGPKGTAREAKTREEDDLQLYYAPIDSYEGKHRYDPKAQWTEQEERKLVRKVVYVSIFGLANEVLMSSTYSWIIKYVPMYASCFLPCNLTGETSLKRYQTTFFVGNLWA